MKAAFINNTSLTSQRVRCRVTLQDLGIFRLKSANFRQSTSSSADIAPRYNPTDLRSDGDPAFLIDENV